MKLGRLPARHDPRTLKLRSYLSQLPPLPASVDWGSKVSNWGMLANDTISDCTVASAGHAIETWTANAATECDPSADAIIATYSAVTGYDPTETDADGNNPTDNGANMLDVLNYWRQTGIAGHVIKAYAAIDCATRENLQAAIYLFGGGHIGVNLPQSAMDDMNDPNPRWVDVTDENIVGGHCVLVVGYDGGGVWLVSWGQMVYASWKWIAAYTKEGYAVMTSDWMETTGNCPPGFNNVQLMKDLKAITEK